MQTETISSLTELEEYASRFIDSLTQTESAVVVGLSGDLGAGKTALTKAFAKKLGIKEEITSPTFVIMKSYQVPNHSFIQTLSHMDAYRIESDDEVRVLGVDSIISDSTQLFVIEWPERIEGVLPEHMITLNIEITEGEKRTISIQTNGN